MLICSSDSSAFLHIQYKKTIKPYRDRRNEKTADLFRPAASFLVSSFLIQNQFRILSVFFICADHDEIHVRKDTEASLTAEFRFQLIS